MPDIHILPDELVSKIAAGEVVERPASVVKELLENALDAAAGRVDVELEAGGKRSVRITDDGHGMDGDDALLAFDRHATSKISSFEDLERVATLGFRGEALSSIAAVARVELTTAVHPGEGYRVRIEGGRIRAAEPASRARGTTLEIASLFFNVPARRKFLKSPQTELRRCLEVVQGYALARPEVHFSVAHEGRSLLDAPRAGGGPDGMRQRIRQIFGATLADHLQEIEGSALPRVGATGFVGDPSTSRGRRLFTFVNRRLLRDRALLAAFYRAVREEWRSDEFPALFLFLELDPREVDVNVHPQKAEVRFRDPMAIEEVATALRDALRRGRGEESAPLRPPGQPLAAPLAWQGLGERRPAWQPADLAHEVAEGPGRGGVPWPNRLADVAYRPEVRSPIPLSGRSGEVRPFRLLGQYKGTLILLEGPDGLYLLDQHVAHERILYERFRVALTGERRPSQTLLEPLLLELAPAETLRLGELAGPLEEHGFALAALSGGSLALTAVPAALSVDEAEAVLVSLASEVPGGGDREPDLAHRLLDALAAGLACRSAVKMHHPLSAVEMEALVAELFRAEQPYACPHGRPIVLQMADAELERRFGRR